METRVLNVDEAGLSCAKEIILSGGIVAFPTETVYGLGANAFDAAAVEKIFAAKGRPKDNPLIVHVADAEMIGSLAEEVPAAAKKVIAAFMPGPLTVVLKKKKTVPDAVTGGLDTVAVRMPASREARLFLRSAGVPVAAPSANASGRPSPTCWRHVLEDLDGKIPLLLKGKDCEIGIESTVVDFTRGEPAVLRPGAVTPSEIGAVLGIKVGAAVEVDALMNSPGLRYGHYVPACAAWLNTDGDAKKIVAKYNELSAGGKKTAVLAQNKYRGEFKSCNFFSLGDTEADGAKKIFALLRKCEKQFDVLIAVWDFKTELGASVLNRLFKSCEGRVF